MPTRLADIASELGAELLGADAVVTGVASLEESGPADLSLCLSRRHSLALRRTRAAGVILPRSAVALRADAPCAVLLVDEPRLALARVLDRLYPQPPFRPGVAAGAHVDPRARIHPSASVGAGACVEAEASVGARTKLEPGAYLGEGVPVGEDCHIGANASVLPGSRLGDRVRLGACAVVGSPGFGFVHDGEQHRRIPQIGTVIIEDDVEIGAGSCVDRGTLGATRIGAGTKIDNLVQVGHNVVVGRQVILAAQVGLSGSVRIEDSAVLGGQAGVADHVVIGEGAQVGAKSGVGTPVAAGARVAGYPAVPVSRWLENAFLWRRVRRILERLRGERPAR